MSPIFRRELKAVAGRREILVLRTVFGLVTGTFFLLVALMAIGPEAFRVDEFAAGDLRRFGRIAFCFVAGGQLFLLSAFVPNLVAGTIAEERERDTLPFLLLTRLTRIEIVANKLMARLVPAFSLLLVGLPLQFATASAAGLFPGTMALIAAAEVTTVVFLGALSIAASAWSDKAATAGAQAVLAGWTWLFAPAIFGMIRARPGSLLGEMVELVKAVCNLIAPSSPLSLATDSRWLYRGGNGELAARLVTMIAMQAGFAALAVFAGTAHLRAREPHPSWMDPYRGYRPPCGDDPIFWREFELPNRRGSPPKLLIWARQLLALFRVLFMVLLQILVVSIALAMPLGLAAGTVFFGVPAFRETWGLGGPAGARHEFNVFLRMATGFVTLMAILLASTVAMSKITVEREKKTWLSLLATPLEGAEILGSKRRASLRGLTGFAWLAAPIWLAGIVCGAVHPLGVGYAALDTGLAVWAGVAFGTWLGVRPGTTSAANSAATFGSLALIAVHMPLVVAALSTSQNLRTSDAWSPWLRGGIAAAMLVVPVLTALMGWLLMRRVYLRFDEWADRPIRPSAPPPAPDVAGPLPAALMGQPAAES